jgi:hypothetical protein
MKTGKITLGLAAAMLLGTLTAASAAGGLYPIEPGSAPEGKSHICHYAGHVDDFVIGPNGKGGKCDRTGGIVILVSDKALKGHKITD